MRKAAYTEARANKVLRNYAYSQEPKMTKAYAVRMSPAQFLMLTANQQTRERIAAETEPLDIDRLRAESQEITLYVTEPNPDHPGFKVVDHEGRHRAMAMMRAGVESIPVTLYFKRGMEVEPIGIGVLTP
jgi:hypothetical protein